MIISLKLILKWIKQFLQLGFIAQSCLAPGFTTLMANLFAMRLQQSSQNFSFIYELADM